MTVKFKSVYKCMATAALFSQIIIFTGATPVSHVFAEEQQQQYGGFFASYYSDSNFKKLALTASTVDKGGNLTPDELDGALDDPIKSVRWQGEIKPTRDGEYKFSTSYDQQVMMEVDGQSVLMQGQQKSIHLKAGQSYNVILEYKNEEGIAPSDFKFNISWSIDNGPSVIIPKGGIVRKVVKPSAPKQSLFDKQPEPSKQTEQPKQTETQITSTTNGWVNVDVNKTVENIDIHNGFYAFMYTKPDFTSPKKTLQNVGIGFGSDISDKDIRAIRWMGTIKPEQTGTYAFQFDHTLGSVKISVDGKRYKAVDSGFPLKATTYQTIPFESGKSYPIIIEWTDDMDDDELAYYKPISLSEHNFKLKWASDKIPMQNVPQSVVVQDTKQPETPKTSLFDASYKGPEGLRGNFPDPRPGSVVSDSHVETYYYENGKKVTGLKEISGQTYYFNPDGVMQTGIQKVNGKLLYFYSQKQGDHPIGSQCKGTDFVDIDTEHAAYVENGVVKTGEIHSNNKMLIADSKGVLQSGWQTIREKKYYIAEEKQGVVKGDSLVVDGKRYGFNLDGTIVENGVLSFGTFKPTVMDIKSETKGTIANTYIFENGALKIGPGLPSTGPISLLSIPNSILKQYLQDDGLLAILSDGVDQNSGKIPTYADKKLYYYGSDCKKLTGWKMVGKDKYYFDPKDGAAVTSIQTIEGQTYLFDENGKLLEHVVRQTGE